MKRTGKSKIIGTFAGLLVIVLIFFFFFKGNKKSELSFQTEPVKIGTIVNTITATGTIDPITQVEVGTQVSGVIKKIYVDYNSEVKKGQLLAEIDRTNLEAQLAETKADLASAENEVDYQQKNMERTQTLFKNKSVSEVDYENAVYQYNKAKASLDKLKSTLQRNLTNLSYASIYSPIDGIVLSRAVDEGQTVAASFNTPTLFTIANDLTKMQVIADIDEADIGQVKDGQRVTFTVDAYPDDTFDGTVTQIRLEPTISSNVVTYSVVVDAPNPDLKLMPGLTASITVYTLEKDNILTIPAKALRFAPDEEVMKDYFAQQMNKKGIKPDFQSMDNQKTGIVPVPPNAEENIDESKKTIWVKENDFIHPQHITIGITDDASIQVIKGLKEGDQVVISMSKGESVKAKTTKTKQASSPFVPTPPKH